MNKEALTTPALEALLQAPSLAILAVDKQGCVILWSPSASRMFGWTESEVLGRFLPIVPQEEKQGVYDRIQNELNSGTVSALDVRRLRKDGSLVDVSLWTALLRDSHREVIGVLGLYADIAARKQTEAAFRESELELRRVLDAASDYFWSGEIDPEGRFRYRYYSPAVERITGRPAEFYMPNPERWMSTVHPEDRARLAEMSERRLSGQPTPSENEHRIVLPDGTIRWVHSKVTVSQLADGYRRVDGVVSDITARKHAEDALRESEANLARAQALAHLGNWTYDLQKDLVSWSDEMYRIYGVNRKTFEHTATGVFRLIHPEDVPLLEQAIESCRKSGTFKPYEYRVVWPDGSIHVVQLIGAEVERDATGQPSRMFGTALDVTDRKRSEEALRESEARFRGIFTSAPAGIVLVSREGRFLEANPAFCDFLGYSEQELLSKTIRDITHPDDRELTAEIVRGVWKGEKPPVRRFEKRYLRKDGQTVWGEVSISLIRDAMGNASYTIAQVLDVTARKQSEDELRESEERYRLMAEAIPQLAWRTNAQGEVTECNGRWYEYTGQTPEEARGNGWMKALRPDDVERVMRSVQGYLTGGGFFELEYRLRRASDGTYRWFLARVLPITDKDGRITSWFGSAVDIDDQKRMQQVLEERVQERTAELEEANQALRESEVKYRTLVEQMPAVTYIKTLDDPSTTLYVSPQIELVLGFSPAECRANPNHWRQHLHPDDRKRAVAEVRRAKVGGKPFDCEYRMLHRSGQVVWIRDKAVVVRDKAGQPLFSQGVMLDVTERHQAEEDLRVLGTALEFAANSVVITDHGGLIVWANPAFTKLTGYEVAEVIGKDMRVLRSGKHDKAFYRNMWQTPLSGRVWHGEIVNKRKDGSLYTEEMTITPVRNAAGEITHFIAIKQDITEWKAAEESRRRLAAIVESSDDAIVSADLNGIISSWNAGAQRLYNYSTEEILGRPAFILEPPDRIGEMREILKMVRCGEHVQHCETVRLKKGGIPIDVAITTSPIKNDTGQTIGLSAITRDITARKELERAIVEAGNREQARIGMDLHDGLCQQLTGIGFMWKTVEQSVAAQTLPDAARVVEIGRLITKTISEARDLARRLGPVELESNDLGAALKGLGSSMGRQFTVSCVVRCREPVLLADGTVATHLYRIAQEAIGNAIRHGKAARVWVDLNWKKNKLALRVRDNGLGFSQRRSFRQGMGIRGMKYRANAIGGVLTIASKRGAGTTVACVCTQPRSRSAGQARRRTSG